MCFYQALLSERITDCHVQKFFSNSYDQDATDDYSHINYNQAATQVSQAKSVLKEEIEIQTMIGKKNSEPSDNNAGTTASSFNEEKNEEINNLKDLFLAATQAMARILSKKGAVYARLDSHHMALVSTLHVSCSLI